MRPLLLLKAAGYALLAAAVTGIASVVATAGVIHQAEKRGGAWWAGDDEERQ